MNPEEINLAIAAQCGWREAFPLKEKPHEDTKRGGILLPYKWINEITKKREQKLPDYCNDLNAMHEAWKELKDYNKREFHIQLGILVEKQTKNWNDLQILDQRGLIANASCIKRAEAFLRTVGKWKK